VVFFQEYQRALKPRGRVCLIEPYVGPLSRLIRPHHHESWDEEGGWTTAASGPADRANMALPRITFTRDRTRYEAGFRTSPSID
jgi:hypothetical protein